MTATPCDTAPDWDRWTDAEAAAAAEGLTRAQVRREARMSCIRCPVLTRCAELAAGLDWHPGVTIGAWSAPAGAGRPGSAYRHPGLAEVWAQHRRDRIEAGKQLARVR